MTPAVDAAKAAGIEFEVVQYEHDPKAESYGLEASELLGVPPERVFKTLLTRMDGKTLVVGIVPVAARLDPKALASAAGGRKAEMADPAEAQRATGYVLGGISPLGQKRRLTTVLDESAQEHETIYVSGGRRGLEIVLAPADLVRLTDARVASIAR
jgi:Cys-tRNA(Pro)/Cys-tRNA(Cys) deacylase